MSSLPPDASTTPQPGAGHGEPGDSPEVPRWAAPAVPPPWAGTGQLTPIPTLASVEPAAQPPAAGYAAAPVAPVVPTVAPAVARKPLLDRQKWLPTVAVAGIVAGVVLGGLGLDKVLAAPSAGTVDIGQSVTITAAPGWVKTETGGSGDGVALQKADAILSATAVLYGGTPSQALSEVEAVLQQDAAQISFGTEHDGAVGGHDAAMVAFSAIVSGPSGSGTIDGEIICLVVSGRAILFEAVAPQGDLDPVADDIVTMVKSVKVVQ